MGTGLIGGTFDPIHLAHLVMAEEALDALGLARVLIIPAARPPHKEGEPVTPLEHRLEMARLATRDDPRLVVSDIEARLPGPSYTIETIRAVKRELGEGERLWFIMGADSLTQFFGWKDPEALIDACEFAVVPRPGIDMSKADPRIVRKATVLPMPLLDIASSDIRDRVRRGRSIRYLVPADVRAYIQEKNLYS